MADSIFVDHEDAHQSPTSVDTDSLVELLCEKAKHLDALLTLMNASAQQVLDEEGQTDLLWLASNLAAEAGNTARQLTGPSVISG